MPEVNADHKFVVEKAVQSWLYTAKLEIVYPPMLGVTAKKP